jgi:hypothetical protein
MLRHLLSLLTLVAATAFVAAPALAADTAHEGTVVSAEAGKLTMTKKGDTKEHSHAITDKTTITLDGKPAKLTDLKKGQHVKVTIDDTMAVTKVEAMAKAPPA